MRLKVIEPQALSEPKLWQLQILDETSHVIAASRGLSEVECRNAERTIRSACKELPPTEYVTRGIG